MNLAFGGFSDAKNKAMRKDQLYTITEWQWLSLQLRLYSLESQGADWRAVYLLRGLDADLDLKSSDTEILCRIYNRQVRGFFDASKDVVETHFASWAVRQQQAVARFVSCLPTLQEQLDLGRHLAVDIMGDYGMGSSLLCTVVGGNVAWTQVGLANFPKDKNAPPN